MVPGDGKYWWCTYACKINYVVKHLLACTALGGLQCPRAVSCQLPFLLQKCDILYFIFIMALWDKE